MAQSLLHLNIWLFCRVVPLGRWHHDIDTRLSPSCHFCSRKISSESLVAAQLVKVKPTSTLCRSFTRCSVMPRHCSRSRRQPKL